MRWWHVLSGLLGAGGVAAAGVIVEPTSIRKQAQEAEELARGFTDLDESNPAGVYRLAVALVRAPERAGFWALKDSWGDLRRASTKETFISTFFAYRGGPGIGPGAGGPLDGADAAGGRAHLHPRLADVLDLAVRDPHAATQSFGLRCLKSLALDDFAEDFRRYEAWRARAVRAGDANAALEESVREFVARAAATPPEGRRELADFLDEHGALMRDLPAARRAALEAGWAGVLGAWLRADEAAMQAAMRLSAGFFTGRAELEAHVVPLLGPEHPGALRAWAAATLGDARAEWSVEVLLDGLRASLATVEDLRPVLPAFARALATLGDPRAIPVLIGAIEAEGTPAASQTVGVYALGPLTGVRITPGHDAAWWRTWWEKNRGRFPGAAGSEIPAAARPADAAPRAGPADGAGMLPPPGPGGDTGPLSPAVQLSAGFDNDQRFYLVGTNPAEPGALAGGAAGTGARGRKLLVVIPGGDGSAAYRVFSQRLHAQALDDSWLVAHLVAPKWDAGQFETLVWPTGKAPWPGARFTTEAFADAVVKEVSARTAIDGGQVYVLAWASGGPAGYAALCRKDAPFAGGVIAMSDFAVGRVESVKGAAGRRVAIIHAEGDGTVPIRAAEVAKEWLGRSGASVELARIAGPRGWPEDAFALLREAVRKVSGE